ncbi:MAG: cysteine desulfuration protein SufE [Verrucomicrobia bacterium]|nr:MAG: cysteine desulfuration protein SufE [Verrucomicrobiota bacterium]
MTPADRQTRLAQELLRFEDPQERLSFVQDRVRRKPPLPDALRTEENRVKGCLTKVWLAPSLSSDRCTFEVDSESPMVRSLAALIAEPFSGATPREVLEFECRILEESGLLKRITPTRLHGLAQLEGAIRSFARSCLSHSQPCI